jgi:hypothetical protein
MKHKPILQKTHVSTLLFLAIVTLSGSIKAAPPTATCVETPVVCDEESFSSYSPIAYLGTSFTSPNGFYFERLTNGQFQVHSLTNIGHALYVPGHTSFMTLPNPRESVSNSQPTI